MHYKQTNIVIIYVRGYPKPWRPCSQCCFQDVYCNFLNLLVNMIALCFWVNQFLIALIRLPKLFSHLLSCSHFKCFLIQHFLLSRRSLIFKICLIRFAYVKFPVKFYNRFPTQKEKSVLFFKLTRLD